MRTTKASARKGLLENPRFAPGAKGSERLHAAVARLLKDASLEDVDAEVRRIAGASPSVRAKIAATEAGR